MATQELQWTAIPYDARKEGEKTMLSVAFCLTPRLQDLTTEDNKLSEYPDFVNWPATVAQCTFKIKVNGEDVELTPRDEQPESAVWKAVFKPTTLVRPFEFKPFLDYEILSFPLAKVKDSVTKQLVDLTKEFNGEPPKLAVEPNQFDKKTYQAPPKILTVLRDLTPDVHDEISAKAVRTRWEIDGKAQAHNVMKNGTSMARSMKKEIKRTQVQIPESPESMQFKSPVADEKPIAPFLMAELFHTSRVYAIDGTQDGKIIARKDRLPIAKPTYDFHQVVSVLREYPLMMRKMGLTLHFDFEMPNGMNANGKVEAVVSMQGPPTIGTEIVTPTTAYHLETSGDVAYWQFLPRPDSDSEIVGPLLCLNDPSHFEVHQVDVDSMAIKTLSYTRGVRHRLVKTFGTKDAETSTEAPSVRGTGLQLVRVNRGIKLAKMLIRSGKHWNKLVAKEKIDLYADDVTRGYRLDVFDATANTWQSLMRRNATYTFPLADEPLKSVGISATDEEGVLTVGASRPPASDNTSTQRQLYAHETIAQWEGWSIVVPLIGVHIDPNDELAPSPPKQSPPPDFDYQVESAVTIVPGSLPRLRYGREYRFRARTVDVAGNGPRYDELNPLDFSCATPLVRYMRWDPVVAPMLALRNHPIEGESMEHMVIRNYNASEDENDAVDTTETSTRHCFPPLAAHQTAERHGLFDPAPTGALKGDNATYELIKSKEGKIPSRWYTRDDDGNLVPEAANDVEPVGSKKKTAIAYPLVEAGSAVTPYLPDPMARTVTLHNVPGMHANNLMEIQTGGANSAVITSSSGVVTIAFELMSDWPIFNSILLKLESGNQPPSWDGATRTLSMYLPKGEQAWIKFSSGMGQDQTEADNNLDLHGHKKTMQDGGMSASQIAAAARGLSWLITPARTLHLTHATQKPLKKPIVNAASVIGREFGATNAEIDIPDTYVDARTTQKIDMFAEWSMWEDDPQKPTPLLVPYSAFFYDQHCEKRTEDKLVNQANEEFGDTKYRLVNYVPLATTRFREHMPKAIRNDKAALTRKGTGKELKVLNTKRPDGVKLLYAIPSFRWVEAEKKLEGNVVRSTRKGGGIRIYMERPWYSSGNGELLGVVLYSTQKFTPSSPPPAEDANSSKKKINTGGLKMIKGGGPSLSASEVSMIGSLLGSGKLEIPEEVEPYVTQWGLDPIWLSAPTPSDNSPRTANFREPALVLPSVSLAEVNPTQRFSVVAYEPKFDEERKLWYCDVEIDPGESYYPFIRLALVRVQPDSLSDSMTGKDVYCSRVSQSTFCQLAPDREATARIEDDRQSVTIQVVGHTYRTNSVGQAGSEMEVAIEKRDVGAGGSDLGWTRVAHQRIDRIHAGNLWGGLVKLPTSVDADEYRVVITENENFFTDPEKAADREQSLGVKTASAWNDSTAGLMHMEVGSRIVYADVLPLR